MGGKMTDNGNGNEAAAKTPPQVVAQIAVEPESGTLLLQVSGVISDPVAFGASAIGLLAQFIQEQHFKNKKPTIEVPKLVVPPLRKGAK